MKRMHRMQTRKSHSWWWDSHISPKNSKWLAENLEEMDKQVKEMLKLIEDEGDSFAKKAEMYFQRRPLLVNHVENFYRMYRALAERYDNVTGELRKGLALQSQGSGISETDSETQSISPSPEPNMEQNTAKPKRKTRAVGFDVFLGSGGSSDISKKGSDGSPSSSSSDSDSEVDEASEENGNGISYIMDGRITELEDELQEARQQIEALEVKNMHCQCEKLEESLKQVSNEKEDLVAAILASKNEIEDLKRDMASTAKHFEAQLVHRGHEIEKCKQEVEQVSEKYFHEKSALESEIERLQEVVKNFERNLTEVTGEKLQLEAQVKELEQVSNNLDDSSAEIIKLQEIIKDLQARLENDSNDKGVLDERAMELEQVRRQLEDSRAEARELQTTIKNLKDDLEKALQEKAELQNRMKDVEQATSDLNSLVASLEGKLTATEAQLEQLHVEKAEASLESEKHLSDLIQAIAHLKTEIEQLSSEKAAVENKVSVLLIDVTTRDEKLKEMDNHLHQLHLEHVKLIEEADIARKDASGLRSRVCELEDEIEKQKLIISDSAEGKREAIRQLCFSLDHYRHGYQQLRQLLQDYKRPVVMAT
ncbi:protein NETWORKED 4B-like [Miscanthus floridulus]|uniref:protein NETWORKED 4B-like n=1 Tax=Miscanthus floridulus TaxID=154761 RepID=UPI0034583226